MKHILSKIIKVYKMHNECYIPVSVLIIGDDAVDERCVVLEKGDERHAAGCSRNGDFIDYGVCDASGLWSILTLGAGLAASGVRCEGVWRQSTMAGGTLLQTEAATTQCSATDDATVDTTAAVPFPAADGTPLRAHICNSTTFGLKSLSE